MNSSKRLIRSLVVISQRKNSEPRTITKVANPTGRYHKNSASSDTNITESIGTFCGYLTKKIKIKQKRKSGGTIDDGIKSIGASDITTKIVPKNIKVTVVSIDL